MLVPPEWWAEAEEDSILVGDLDDVGCIEISTLHKEVGEFSQAEIRAIAEAEAEGDWDWKAANVGEFQGWHASYLETGDVAIREWYLGNGGMLLFITYSCDGENRGMDDAAVDEILDTLQLAPPP